MLNCGEMAHAPEAILKNFEINLVGPNALRPRWVAYAVEPYNKAADDMQKGMYAAFGMADVLQLKM
jgi:hypothetical protein